MPHHMEYATPPAGELLFMNAHHHELSLLVDISDPRAPRVAKTFTPPAPLRFPHDYSRTPKGTRLVGFLRSEGPSPDPAETVTPGNHGGIAEYTADGVLLRQAMAGNAGSKPVRPISRHAPLRRGALVLGKRSVSEPWGSQSPLRLLAEVGLELVDAEGPYARLHASWRRSASGSPAAAG